MGYLAGDDGPSIMQNAGRFVLVLVTVFAAKAAVTFGMDQYRARTMNFDKMVETMAENQPDMAEMFATMHRKFPAEYAEFGNSMIALARSGAKIEEVQATAAKGMRQFMQSHVKELAQASSADLLAFNRQQIAVAKALSAADPTLCAHFVMSGLQIGDRPPEPVLGELAKAGVIQLNGIAAGRQSPAHRKVDDVSDADARAMVAAMKTAGLTDSELRVFGSPTSLSTASMTTQCRLGIGLLEGISTMPADQAARITGYLITHA